jgi:hypothetical protein
MSIHYRYRINGGQVLGMSVNPYEAEPYFANVTDPLEPDGRNLQPPKIHDAGTVRNATAPEIAAFADAEAEDQNLIDRESAKGIFSHSVSKKTFSAFIRVLLDEINTLRQQHSLPDRTVSQAIAAIQSRIDAGDYD